MCGGHSRSKAQVALHLPQSRSIRCCHWVWITTAAGVQIPAIPAGASYLPLHPTPSDHEHHSNIDSDNQGIPELSSDVPVDFNQYTVGHLHHPKGGLASHAYNHSNKLLTGAPGWSTLLDYLPPAKRSWLKCSSVELQVRRGIMMFVIDEIALTTQTYNPT